MPGKRIARKEEHAGIELMLRYLRLEAGSLQVLCKGLDVEGGDLFKVEGTGFYAYRLVSVIFEHNAYYETGADGSHGPPYGPTARCNDQGNFTVYWIQAGLRPTDSPDNADLQGVFTYDDLGQIMAETTIVWPPLPAHK